MSAAKKSIATTEAHGRLSRTNSILKMAGFPAIFIGAASTAQGARRSKTLGASDEVVRQPTGDGVSRG